MLKHLFQRKSRETLSCEILNSGFAFDLQDKATILQSAMNAGVTMAHNCQVGSCKECCCKLIEGDIKSHVELDYLFDKEEIEAGYFLPCQSVAKTSVVIESLKDFSDTDGYATVSVESIRSLTPKIKRLTVRSQKPIYPKPGQYCNLMLPESGEYRSYSFSEQDDIEMLYSFDITHHAAGRVSAHLLSQAAIGSEIKVSKPHGCFSLSNAKGPVLCIVAGSGQGAVMNILRSSKETLKHRPVFFMCSTKTMSGQYSKSDIDELNQLSDCHYIPFLTQAQPNDIQTQSGYTRIGRIPLQLKQELSKLLEQCSLSSDFEDWSVLLCGAPGLIDDSLTVLDDMGFRKNHIAFDKYELSGG
ncbi:2Fe-2S iron-sulfur cluster-binding protein [Kangiella taiwanensis]|uniref:NQR complex subunit F n=1 Tax=Kangiella taiwanensis TaxID=1079179 RepID=A0ABP8HSC9_9GAMM|nr:2Fe-2S iron-sulfur cluster binding domain-containing protein [Kangiella taiwanensis]